MNKIKSLAVIADIHGNKEEHLKAISEFEYTLQLGDLGFNYDYLWDGDIDADHHKFILGNHDNYDDVKRPRKIDGKWENLKHCLFEHSYKRYQYPNAPKISNFNYGVFPGIKLAEYNNLFVIGGAHSIDKEARLRAMRSGEPKCWWIQEEMDQITIHGCIESYLGCCPDILVTHDCPAFLYPYVMPDGLRRPYEMITNRTASFLQLLFSLHKPRRWIFGHHHTMFSRTVEDCHFTCIPPGVWKEFPLKVD